jgi:hypothetical protein
MIGSFDKSLLSSIMVVQEPLQLVFVLVTQLSSVLSLAINISGLK